jgi:hypothetical protein
VDQVWHFVPSQSTRRILVGVLALVLGLVATAIYGIAVNDAYPVQDWLLWDMLKIWLWLALFVAGCVSFGQFVLVRLPSVGKLTAPESAVMSMTVGVVALTIGMYLAGAFGHFTEVTVVELPVVMLVAGARDGHGLLRTLRHEAVAARYNWLSWVITGYGLLFLGLVYFGVMTPNTIGTDASMVHMKIAPRKHSLRMGLHRSRTTTRGAALDAGAACRILFVPHDTGGCLRSNTANGRGPSAASWLGRSLLVSGILCV